MRCLSLLLATPPHLHLDNGRFDIDYMDSWHDWTYSPSRFPTADVAAFVERLHGDGRSFVVIVDPGILAVDPRWDRAISSRVRMSSLHHEKE